MSISEPFIRRPVATSLLAAGLLLIGAVAYHFLPVAPLPRVDFPTISVSANLPGVDPATASSSLAAPLERAFSQIPGVSEMTSVSSVGGSTVTLQFDLSRKIDAAAHDVEAAINAAAGDLPLNLPNPPTYRKVNPADAPIIILGMTSDTMTLPEVYNLADQTIGQRLSQVEGVSQVLIGGGANSAVRVQVNPGALASMGISIEDVRSVLGLVNVDMAKGSLNGPRETYVVESNDQLTKASQYNSVIIGQHNGVPIPLSSVGTVLDSTLNTQQAGWYGNKRAVLLIIFKQAGANVIETVDQIKAAMPQLQRWLPPSVKLSVLSDRTITIRASVHDVQITLLITVMLVVVVMFVFLHRFWPTFISGVAIPLALMGTFGAMYLFSYSIDNISLMALTVCVGFVVDDAIVVIENIVRHIENGTKPFQAALDGARQIGFTVVSISVSLVAVFIPLLFMGGLIGRLFHEFAVTLSVAILVSGVVSLTLTPMMCALFLRPERETQKRGWFHATTERFFDWMLGWYEHGLSWVIRRQYLMIFATLAVIGTTIWLYVIVPKGFFPQQDTGMMMGITEAAQDISFPAMAKLQSQVADIVLADPAVQTLGSFIGAGGGGALNNGRMFITLKPKEERDAGADQIIARLRQKLTKVAGISLFLQPTQDIRVGGRATKALYQYALTDPDLNELQQWAPRLVAAMKKHPEIKDANSDQLFAGLQMNVVVDRDAASRLGILPAAVDSTLYSAFGQRQVSIIYTQSNEYRVVLEVDPQFQLEPASLDKIYVKSTNGNQVPLSAIARFQTGNAPLSINHQGQFPAVTLSFNLAPGISLGQATSIIDQDAASLGMPATVRGSFQGTAQVFQSSLSTQPMLILTALIAVYIVLGMLYESLIHPITILSTLPSAGLGALLALLLTGNDLSVVSTIGIVLLIGIVKKNAIMMVDFAIEAEREQGLTPEKAIYQACLVRFRPIMMTTMAALFGALPLALGTGVGSELRRPLGVAIVGGLIVSQMLTLYSTPVIYLAFEHLGHWKRNRKRAVVGELAMAQ